MLFHLQGQGGTHKYTIAFIEAKNVEQVGQFAEYMYSNKCGYGFIIEPVDIIVIDENKMSEVRNLKIEREQLQHRLNVIDTKLSNLR